MMLVLLVTPFSGAGTDVYVPSLPVITEVMDTTRTLTKLTIPAYLLGYGLGQPIFGTLSDIYGRRSPMLWGLFLFAISCALAPLSTSIYILLALRVLQGLAVAGPAAVSKAVLTDCFQGQEHRRASNQMVMVWAMGPILAPALGGYLHTYFGWGSTFYFLAIYAGVAWLLSLLYWSESNVHSGSISLSNIVDNYRTILGSRPFLGALICMGLVASILAVFNVVGPFLVQDTLGYDPIDYGHLALVLGFAWFLGSTISKSMVNRMSQDGLIRLCLWVGIAGVGIALAVADKLPLNLWVLALPTFFIYVVGGTIFPNCMAKCLSAFPKMAGAASAAMGALFTLAMAVTSGAASLFHSASAVPLFAIFGGLLVAGLLFFSLLRSRA